MRRHNHNGRGKQRQMQYMPSVSRSSGIDKDGDSLKNTRVQEEYRAYIAEKLNAVLSEASADDSAEENVLILFRKLREGLYSSKRTDLFAVEVYETSLYLSVVFNKPRYISSIIPHLLFELYPKHTTSPNLTLSVLVSLLHNLAAGFPSQVAYREVLSKIPPVLKFNDQWICWNSKPIPITDRLVSTKDRSDETSRTSPGLTNGVPIWTVVLLIV
ncbi:hypothetical protein CYLTODRAFT_493954 [Cylindrobasidium torrendii FP15055 ss-10]|uniref:Uncharacterized protein n=1 Tax=Cylindrobasidium torrendii FP15055 ss-10 TaxID=1314674 RepID=A0A0D7AYB9_9AGAR|nr:hypothetical protein CYLTODRAFT_493954 [Cylindrobasidium torrendii FP15055 ss-10]